jgi:hypothetical protein
MENRPNSARLPDESASAAAAKFVMLAVPCAAAASNHAREGLVLRVNCLTADPVSEGIRSPCRVPDRQRCSCPCDPLLHRPGSDPAPAYALALRHWIARSTRHRNRCRSRRRRLPGSWVPSRTGHDGPELDARALEHERRPAVRPVFPGAGGCIIDSVRGQTSRSGRVPETTTGWWPITAAPS